ncbi:hypothetical protein IWY39_004876 [Sphingobium sp. JAI105]|nr:hypothetical protein [Sphingobium sp. JAI105]
MRAVNGSNAIARTADYLSNSARVRTGDYQNQNVKSLVLDKDHF